jgi:transposase
MPNSIIPEVLKRSSGKRHGNSGKPPISNEKKQEICRIACREKPENETRWNTRKLGKRVRVGYDAVNRILRERGIQPYLVKKFQFNNDPDFVSKLNDVVGLYIL